jgi:hypothetical protein
MKAPVLAFTNPEGRARNSGDLDLLRQYRRATRTKRDDIRWLAAAPEAETNNLARPVITIDRDDDREGA